jgi:hypothetical protein
VPPQPGNARQIVDISAGVLAVVRRAAATGELGGEFVGQSDRRAVADADRSEPAEQHDVDRVSGDDLGNDPLEGFAEEGDQLGREPLLNRLGSDDDAELGRSDDVLVESGTGGFEEGEDQRLEEGHAGELTLPSNDTGLATDLVER